jgi:hypothetical protein
MLLFLVPHNLPRPSRHHKASEYSSLEEGEEETVVALAP